MHMTDHVMIKRNSSNIHLFHNFLLNTLIRILKSIINFIIPHVTVCSTLKLLYLEEGNYRCRLKLSEQCDRKAGKI